MFPSTTLETPPPARTSLPRIVYVGGFGRSGSTVLDMLLGSQPRVFGAGEVTHLFDWWIVNDNCSCGRAVRACPFWNDVMGIVIGRLGGTTVADAARITRRVETGLGPGWSPRGRSRETMARYGEIWRTTMSAVGEVGGADVVVDSSKSTRLVARRAAALAGCAGLGVDVVHLVRDPRAVMWSTLRGSNRRLESNLPARIRGGIGRSLASWYGANACVHDLDRSGDVRVYRLRYEDLVTDPTGQVRRLAKALDLDLDALIDMLGTDYHLRPDHGVAGNRTRRRGIQNLRLDEEWKKRLPLYAKVIALAGWPLARRYGYHLSENRIR